MIKITEIRNITPLLADNIDVCSCSLLTNAGFLGRVAQKGFWSATACRRFGINLARSIAKRRRPPHSKIGLGTDAELKFCPLPYEPWVIHNKVSRNSSSLP